MKVSKELREIWDNLQNGESYYTISRYPDGEEYHRALIFIGVSQLPKCYGKEYIYWNHYGASANPVKISELYWIITTIFDMTPKEFIQKYQHE